METRIYKKCVKIQSVYRGFIFRIKNLPLIMLKIQFFLKSSKNLIFSKQSDDGRINSCLDEDTIIKILIDNFKDRIKKSNSRMWHDFIIYDNYYGWIPVNIKTTTTKTADNTGNLAMCVYAYTDKILKLDKIYENGKMSVVLLEKFKNKNYNTRHKKDYYFLVVNKNNTSEIIINSLKGLEKITPNVNNLPFQVIWNKNKYFVYKNIQYRIEEFIKCLKNPKPSWKETFMFEIRQLQDMN